MSTGVKASFAVKSWDEKTWDGKPAAEVTGAKVTRAQVTYTYEGDITGDGAMQYLMVYRDDGTGHYVGLERVMGSVGGRSGSFVLQHSGTFDNQGVKGTLFVVPGSGADGLRGLRGEGGIDLAGHQPRYPITLDYRFE